MIVKDAVIEIPKDSILKYEIKNNTLYLDRINTMPCPFNYGFIQNTIAEDGDPIDVFVVTEHILQPNTHVKVFIHYEFECLDNGVPDNKLVASLTKDPPSEQDLVKIYTYLTNYKKGFVIK